MTSIVIIPVCASSARQTFFGAHETMDTGGCSRCCCCSSCCEPSCSPSAVSSSAAIGWYPWMKAVIMAAGASFAPGTQRSSQRTECVALCGNCLQTISYFLSCCCFYQINIFDYPASQASCCPCLRSPSLFDVISLSLSLSHRILHTLRTLTRFVNTCVFSLHSLRRLFYCLRWFVFVFFFLFMRSQEGLITLLCLLSIEPR